MARWTTADIPPMDGRSVVITGAGGLGFETAVALARVGADVTIAGRTAAKGAQAVTAIAAQVPQALIRFELLDLADLASIAAFADRLTAARGALDILVNNAGVMAPPDRRTTADGFELQLGTNHLGHFALTARLLPLLRAGKRPRVVTVSSLAHRGGKIAFDDLQSERSYKPWAAYSQSKLANLLFARELQRRGDAAGWGLTSIAAHPGASNTELIANGPGRLQGIVLNLVGRLFFQSAQQGALPQLYAASMPDARPGGYYGPDGRREMKGWPKEAEVMPQARDAAVAKRLWEVSETLTGVKFP